jgi:hypothetical protein
MQSRKLTPEEAEEMRAVATPVPGASNSGPRFTATKITKEDAENLKKIYQQTPKPTPPRPIMPDTSTPLERAGQRLSESATQRFQKASDIVLERGEFAEGLPTSVQATGVVGQAFGFGWDASGELFNLALDGWSYAIPDSVEESAAQAMRDGMQAFYEHPLGKQAQQALIMGEDSWFEFKDNHPDFALVVESVFNIVPWFRRGPNAKPIARTPEGTPNPAFVDPKTRQVNRLSGRQRGIWKVIAPSKTPSQANQQTTAPQGPFRTQQTVLTQAEIDQVETVAKYTRVDPTRTDRTNAQDLQTAIDTLETRLQKALANVQVEIPKERILESAKARLIAYRNKFPGLGITNKQLREALSQLQVTLSQFGNTPAEILKARRAIDDFRRTKFGQDSFKKAEGKKKATARVEIYDIIRNVMNDSIDFDAFEAVPTSPLSRKATTSNTRQLLREQSHLIQALETINAKYPEGSTVMARVRQNMAALNMTLPSTPLAQAATINAIGAPKIAAMMAGLYIPVWGYKAGKAVLSKGYYQKELRLTVEGIDKALKVAKDPEMIKQLRLDRAAIINIYRGYMEDAEQESKERRPPLKSAATSGP